MKTYNGKNITKKAIEAVLRSQDSTEIFRLVHLIYGGKVERSKVFDFVQEFAPTTKVFNAAYSIAYTRNAYCQDSEQMIRNSSSFSRANQKHEAIQCLRENLQDTTSNYAKRPIMGHTHLYFASPVYQHKDYNKWRSIEIKGNERFCEVICRLADKYFTINND